MKGDDIAERLLGLANGALDMVDEIPRTISGGVVARQLARCGTAGGANYEEARRAESPADFVHEAGVAAKEAAETTYWLKLARRFRLKQPERLPTLLGEAEELVAILRSSARTARKRVERTTTKNGERGTANGE